MNHHPKCKCDMCLCYNNNIEDLCIRYKNRVLLQMLSNEFDMKIYNDDFDEPIEDLYLLRNGIRYIQECNQRPIGRY
jgi:hypothetical protein